MQRAVILIGFFASAGLVSAARAQDHGSTSGRDKPHAQSVPDAEHGPAEHDAHGDSHDHGPKYDLMSIDGMTAIWTIIIFLVLLVVLRAAAWKPIQKALVDREKFIHDSLQQAKADREAAEARLKEYTARLEAAHKEAGAIAEEARRDASVVKQRIEDEAKEEADRMIERAKREIGIAADAATKELITLSAKLATEVASRVIRKELNPAEHERLIADSIKEFQKAGPNQTLLKSNGTR